MRRRSTCFETKQNFLIKNEPRGLFFKKVQGLIKLDVLVNLRGTCVKKVTSPMIASLGLVLLFAGVVIQSLKLVEVEPVFAVLAAAAILALVAKSFSNQIKLKKIAEKKIPILRLRTQKVAERAHDFIIGRVTELRRPLQGLVGIQELFSSDTSAQSANDFFEIADFCSRYLIRQLERIQFFSELEKQTIRIEKSDFSLRTMVSEALKIASEQANSKEITIIEDWSADVPDQVRAHQPALRQILIELLDNSIRFGGGRRVHLKISPDPENKDSFFMHVSDSGPGLSDRQLELLKSPISSGDRLIPWSEIRKGLGHALIKKLADRIGARLFVDSRRGVGTSISMSFKAEPAVAAVEKKGGPRTLVHRRPLRILVVDDEIVTRQVVCGLLQTLGYHAETAINGHDAVMRAQRDHYDLIMLDIEMPVLDGMQAADIILNGLHLSQKPHIAMLTSHCTQDVRDSIAALGVTQFMSKPAGRDEIATAIDQAYEKIEEHLKLTQEASEFVKLDSGSKEAPREATSLINFNKLYSNFGENISSCRQVLYNASDILTSDLEALSEMITKKNHIKTLSVLHKIRGEVGAIMCESAVLAIDRMAECVKEGDSKVIQKEFDQLAELIEMVLVEIEGLNQQNLQAA